MLLASTFWWRTVKEIFQTGDKEEQPQSRAVFPTFFGQATNLQRNVSKEISRSLQQLHVAMFTINSFCSFPVKVENEKEKMSECPNIDLLYVDGHRFVQFAPGQTHFIASRSRSRIPKLAFYSPLFARVDNVNFVLSVQFPGDMEVIDYNRSERKIECIEGPHLRK